ncbi:DUF4837 family protein [candidate division KSB1 bacterium]
MKTKNLLFLILIMGLVLECGQFKRRARGDFNALSVICSLEDWVEIKDLIGETFEKEVSVPQTEKTMLVYHTEPEQWALRKKERNIVFISTLNSSGTMRTFIEGMLSAESRKGVEEGEYFYFLKEDVWANGQSVLFLVAKDMETLKSKIIENKYLLYSLVESKVREWVSYSIYHLGYNEEENAYLLENNNFTFNVPYDYHKFMNEEENFFLFRKWEPDRMIFFYFQDAGTDSKVDSLWVLNTRDDLCSKYFDEAVVDRVNIGINSEVVGFLGRKAIRTSGLWKNDKKIIGGPFINYSFFDEEESKIVMIDLAVFNPNIQSSSKAPYLRQLEVIARTFKFKNEVKEAASE